MGRANIERLMQMLTGDRAARSPAPTEAMNMAIACVERDGAGEIEDCEEMCARQCAAMMQHLTGTIPSTKEAEATARRILGEHYSGGFDGACFALHMETRGELDRIVNVLFEVLSREEAERRFSRAMKECVDASDQDDVLALVTQYLARHGQTVFGNACPAPESLAPRYKELIRDHVAFVRGMQAKFGVSGGAP